MTQKQTMGEEDFPVDLTLHNFSAATLREFAIKIIRPYYKGNINEALRELMDKAIEEETIFKHTLIVSKTL